jgi:hypothetical protein
MSVEGLWRDETEDLLIRIHAGVQLNDKGLFPVYGCHADVLKGDSRDLNISYRIPILISVIPKRDFKITVKTFKSMGREFLLQVVEIPESKFVNPRYSPMLTQALMVGMSDKELDRYRPAGVTMEKFKGAMEEFKGAMECQ